uniref:Conjugative relaxase domain protein n=1 Tax=Geobacter sp. (strain M21) TaxID=443144 RepID=C6DZ94_GEOSM
MLSLSNGGMTASQAGKYFAAEDYYLKGGESSRWLGKTTAELKLAGKVGEEEFRNLCAGKTPDGAAQLVAPKVVRKEGEPQELHRAGNDLTFSAPKSLSIGYAAGNHELKEIWDQAVENTMRYVEEHYSQYRTPHGIRNAGNLLAAKFDHVTSRALDPDVHSHVFLLNMVHTPDGRWLANEPKSIYQDKISIGMLARQESICLLRQAGYQVYFTDREKFLFEIEGVSPEEIEFFSKRGAAIEEQVAEWQQEGKYPGVSETLLKQWAAFGTRDHKLKITIQEIRQKWDQWFVEVGGTAQEVRERIEATKQLGQEADAGNSGKTESQPLTPTHSFPPEKTAREVLKDASSFLTDKEVIFDRAQLIKTAVRISGGEHDIRQIENALKEKREVHFLGQEPRGPQAGREFFTTREMLKLEARNVEALEYLGAFAPVTSNSEVEAYLKGLAGAGEGTLTREEASFTEAFEAGAASAAPTGFLNLTPGQREYVLNELAGDKGFTVTQGDPGTGKTFAAGVVERFNDEVLQPSGRAHHTLNLAYTGKAALEMEQASGKEAFTVDSFLNRYRKSPDLSAFPGMERPAPRGAQVALKLDEASFVGGRQAEHLLRVVQDLKSKGVQVKLSMIGDTKQLQSIQASPFFSHASELARQELGDFALMKEITRQKDAGLLDVAESLNLEGEQRLLGKNATDALKLLEQQGRVREIPTYDALMQAAVECYVEEAAKPSRDPAAAAAGEKQSVLIVTPLNADRQELNAKIRATKMEKGELGQGVAVQVYVPVEQGVTASSYHPGMNIVFTGKRAKDGAMEVPEGVALNQQGEVLSVDPVRNRVAVVFQGDRGGTTTKTFEASGLANKSALYRVEEREFAAGDIVVCNKTTFDRSTVSARSGKTIKLRNGERGVIEAMEAAEKGSVALIRFPGDRVVKVNLDRFGPQHIEHGYAVTAHKAEGETVDSVISFNYVRPASQNHGNALQTLTGIDTTEEQFRCWDGAVTDYEKRYQLMTEVGGHPGRISFVMIADAQNAEEHKGIALTFVNSPAVVKDVEVRQQMREAGMYWAKKARSWVTAVVNDRAMGIMSGHPLRDQGYLNHLREQFVKESPPGTHALQTLTGIDTTEEQFRCWDGAVTEYEKRYQLETEVGGHPGRISFVMITDRQNAEEHKGIAITFVNSPAVVKDVEVRQQMREAGMYWAKDAHSWVTAAVNDRAMGIMSGHPLRDQGYLNHLREQFVKERPPGTPLPVDSPTVHAEIDSTIDVERYGRASYNLLNVALTRSRYQTTVFTNSLEGLDQAVQTVDQKTTSITSAMLQRKPPSLPTRSQERPSRQHQKKADKARSVPPASPVKAPDRELAKELIRKKPS